MWTEELQLKNMKIVADKGLWYRAVAFDFETKVLKLDEFLTGEIILGVSLARRVSSGEIEKEIIILDDESDEGELELLRKLDKILLQWKPLLIIGYFCRDYDLPLLSCKKQKYKLLGHKLWGITNIINGALHIELADLSRYTLDKKYQESRGYRSMEIVMDHEHFSELPFINTKKLIRTSRETKGLDIYNSWKNKDPKYQKYLEAEAHDQLLIAEKIRDTEFKLV